MENHTKYRLFNLFLNNSMKQSYGPFYNANNHLCNNIYKKSGKCNTYLAYDLGKKNYGDDDGNDDYYIDSQSQEKVQCSFMESIRYGTYDAYGEIYMSSSQSTTRRASITGGQKFLLLFVSMIAIGLALYSCYLHHEMTNLLLKSLSSGLIAKRRRSTSRGRSSSRNYRRPSSASTKPSSNQKKSYERPTTASSQSSAKPTSAASKSNERPESAASKSSNNTKQTKKKIMKKSFSSDDETASSADYTLDSSVGSSEDSSTVGGSSSFSVGSSTLGSYAVSKDED